MAPIIFFAVLGLFMGVISVLPWPESPGALLIVQVLSAVALLLGPIAVYSVVATWLNRRAITAVAKAWCAERNVLFERAEMHKNHHAVVFTENAQKKRAKFRVKFVPTTWRIREVTWL